MVELSHNAHVIEDVVIVEYVKQLVICGTQDKLSFVTIYVGSHSSHFKVELTVDGLYRAQLSILVLQDLLSSVKYKGVWHLVHTPEN
jgi:hypothetical protein